MREFRAADGMQWVVFLTARSVARDRHLPEEYREGWLAFESAQGEKRRLAPVPTGWEALTDRELSELCVRATPQVPRKKAAQPDALRPQLHALETRLSSALGEVCEMPPPGSSTPVS